MTAPIPDYILPACQNVGCRATAIWQMLLANGKTKQWRCLSHWRNGKPPLSRSEPVFPRSYPDELAKFDERTKVCTMNCGSALGDPRSKKESKFQCGDCLTVKVSK